MHVTKSNNQFHMKIFKIKGLTLIALIFFAMLWQSCKTEKTEVVICGTLHGFHKNNPAYSYDDIFDYIEMVDPDIIGAEIRPEDIFLPDSLLSQFYPYEMTEVLSRFNFIPVYGIDWWDKGAEGYVVSKKLIESLKQVCLENQLSADSSMMNKQPAILDTLRNKKLQMARVSSMESIMHGCFDSINAEYYRLFELYVNGTRYHELYNIYMLRHQKIGQNMVDIVKKHPGKRILFLTGAEHQVFARDVLKANCSANILTGLDI